MRTNRIASLALACALASYGARPAAALAAVSPDNPADSQASAPPAVVDPSGALAGCASDPDETAADAAGLCSNPFTRAITAPFRALASLFGEDKKDDRKDSRRADAAKRDEKQSQRATRGPAAPAVPTAADTNDGAAKAGDDQPTYAPAPAESAESAARAAQSAEHAASYAPAPPAPSRAAEAAAPFTPLVVGVPNDPVSQGRALIQHGLYEEAISELSVAAATGLNLVEANNLLGLAYDHRGEHERARGFYERALVLAPRDAHVMSNLGYSLYLDDRPREALAKLKTALRIDPSSAETYNNLGIVFARLNRYDDAFRSFTQAGGDLYARLRTASLLEQAGRDRDAIRHYEAARKLDPSSADVLRRLITLYNRTGRPDKAETVERALDKPKSRASGATTD